MNVVLAKNCACQVGGAQAAEAGATPSAYSAPVLMTSAVAVATARREVRVSTYTAGSSFC